MDSRNKLVALTHFVLAFLLVIAATGVDAYPPSSGCNVVATGGGAAGNYPSAAAFEAAWAAANPGSTLHYCTGPGPGASCLPIRGAPVCPGPDMAYLVLETGGAFFAAGQVNSSPVGASCPNGGTLNGAGTSCDCAPGQTDTGTACTGSPTSCPAAGTSLGTHNVTGAWALSPTPEANDYVGGTQTNFFPGSPQCVPEGGGYCGGTVSPTGGGNCWRSQAPADTGLYRISCDVEVTASGSSCTLTAGSPSDPAAAPPACPTGNVGTVNGKPVCLGTMPTTGINFGRDENAGNPRAGSPSTDNNTAREPNSGAGGGPDARGGPGVTYGQDGGVGTGSDRTPGANNNGEAPKLELPTDYNREPTQQSILNELKKKRQIDETGTPDGNGFDTDARTEINSEAGKAQSSLEGIIAGSNAPDRTWGFSVNFPTTCNPMTVGTANWGFFVIDFCQWQDIIHDLMSLVWIGATIFLCIGMAMRAVTGGGA